MPRLSVKQTYSPTSHLIQLKIIIKKFVYPIITDFNQRINKNTVPIEIVLSFLLPHKICQLNAEELQRVKSHLWEKYSELLNLNISTYNNENIFKSEFKLCKAKCKSNNTMYNVLDNIELLKSYDKDIYANCNFLIIIRFWLYYL
jgi:hypothetical protein